MDQSLVGLAFTGGLVAALNPCGFALLPAYLALVVRGEDTSPVAAVGRALATTAAMAVGFVAMFGTFGLLAVSVASVVQRYVPYVTVAIGIVLVVLGVWLLIGRELAVLIPLSRSARWAPTARIGSMFGYGVGYALASLSCTVGPFLAITAVSLRNGHVLEGLWVYVAYGAGMAAIAGVLAVAVAVARSTVVERFRRMVPYVNRISGGVLVLVGLYVGYYGIYEVLLFAGGGSADDRVIAVVGRVQGALAAWVYQHGAWPWVVAIAALVSLAVLWTVWRKYGRFRGRRSGESPVSTPGRPVATPQLVSPGGERPQSGPQQHVLRSEDTRFPHPNGCSPDCQDSAAAEH
jgi:cytochrome c biogenesis protein CcdA